MRRTRTSCWPRFARWAPSFTSRRATGRRVVLDEGGSLVERGRRVYRLLLDLPVAVDLVVYTPEEHERLKSFQSTVAGIAEQEGKVLVG